jgi:hypothetical protein
MSSNLNRLAYRWYYLNKYPQLPPEIDLKQNKLIIRII